MESILKILFILKTHKVLAFSGAVFLGSIGLIAIQKLLPAKEIALIIGEPWKDMQARSSAKIADDIPGEIWYRLPKELAYLRFADPEHAFITPPAKYLSIVFDRGTVFSVRMSPQVEPLLLQEALDVILNLQD